MNILKLLIPLAALLLFAGCSGKYAVAPKKSGAKPTMYIKSNTAEKFKDVTRATAIWSGIDQSFFENEHYMRCDAQDVLIASAAEMGFELTNDESKADYTVENTLLSCSSAYNGNRLDIPFKEKALYKDFVIYAKDKGSRRFTDIMEFTQRLGREEPEALKIFHEKGFQRLIIGFEYSEFWKTEYDRAFEYSAKMKEDFLREKYSGIKKDEVELIKKYGTPRFDFDKILPSASRMSSDLVGHGAATGGNAGGAMIALGVLSSLGGVHPPRSINLIKVINNKNGKSWFKEHEMYYGVGWGSLVRDIRMDIPWKELE